MKAWDFVLVILCVEAAVLTRGAGEPGQHSSVGNVETRQPTLALAQAEGLRCHKSQRQLPRARRPGWGQGIRPRGHSPGSERGEGGAGKGNLPPVPDGSTGGPCWRHGKGVHWRQQGMVLGGKQSAALLSLSLRLLHRGAGQLLAPNLYQLSKYSCPDTGCWIARGRNSVPHRQQLVKHLTPSLLWAGSLFLSCRKESRASEAGPLPAESLLARGIPPGTN